MNPSQVLAKYIFENLTNDVSVRVEFLRNLKVESKLMYKQVEQEIVKLGEEATAKLFEKMTKIQEPITQEKVFKFLDTLRESGITNMFGAASYIVEEFGIKKDEAVVFLTAWMKSK